MRSQQRIKRLFDIVAAAMLLITLSPVLLIAAFGILLTEGRPVFYCSPRMTSCSRESTIYKFRTMVRHANHPRHRLQERYMKNGYLDIPSDAEVYTPIGRLLERSQLVEIPQLINVLKGEMSLIGNRPLPKKNLELLRTQEDWQQRFSCPTGITGISQVAGKLSLNSEQRLYLETRYAQVWQQGNILRCDLIILIQTPVMLVTGKTLPYTKALNMLQRCLPPS